MVYNESKMLPSLKLLKDKLNFNGNRKSRRVPDKVAVKTGKLAVEPEVVAADSGIFAVGAV